MTARSVKRARTVRVVEEEEEEELEASVHDVSLGQQTAEPISRQASSQAESSTTNATTDNGKENRKSDANSRSSAQAWVIRSEHQLAGVLPAARREQNRISQEKSRSKREEYTRKLEAEVRLKSYSSSAQSIVLMKTLNVIMAENTRLRELLTHVSSFIGLGQGGELAMSGLRRQDLQDAIDSDDVQLLTRVALRLKDVADQAEAQIAARDSQPAPATVSRSAAATATAGTGAHQNPMPIPSSRIAEPSPVEVPPSTNTLESGTFVNLPSTAHSVSLQPDWSTAAKLNFASYHSDALPGSSGNLSSLPLDLNHFLAQPLQSNSHTATQTDGYLLSDYLIPEVLTTPQAAAQELPYCPPPHVQAAKSFGCQLATQAAQLMQYHISMKHHDPAYKLPTFLERTLLQKIVPYDGCIDRIIWPSMRDKLITQQEEQKNRGTLSYTSQQIVDELWTDLVVHPHSDLLDVQAWEISEIFIRKHAALVDVDMLQVCNKWRMARNETVIVL